MTQLLPPKKEVALALLERSNVDVYLDPRAKGVVVPPQFRKEPRLILKIGLNMPVPIPDLRLDDESMSCTLSFNRAKFFCVVPWLSVFAMVGDDGRGMVWPDDVPQELAVRSDDRKPSGPELAPVPAPASSRGGKGKPRAVETADSSSSERATGKGGKKTGGKKKKDEASATRNAPARPVLVALPSPEKTAERRSEKSVAADKSAPRIESSPRVERAASGPESAPLVEAAESRPSTPGSKKSSPELPADSKPAAPPPPRTGSLGDRPSSRPKRELPPYLRVVK